MVSGTAEELEVNLICYSEQQRSQAGQQTVDAQYKAAWLQPAPPALRIHTPQVVCLLLDTWAGWSCGVWAPAGLNNSGETKPPSTEERRKGGRGADVVRRGHLSAGAKAARCLLRTCGSAAGLGREETEGEKRVDEQRQRQRQAPPFLLGFEPLVVRAVYVLFFLLSVYVLLLTRWATNLHYGKK